jgi:hypothetical protein
MQLLQRLTRLGLPAILAAVTVVAAGTALAATTCFDFSSSPVGTTNHVGDVIVTPTADIELKQFQTTAGWDFGGFTEVVASNYADGSPSKELWVNNINVRIVPDTPAYAANFLYAYYGGTTNFAVNSDFRNIGDNPPSTFDGWTVGGSDINVIWTPFFGGELGEVLITPTAGNQIDRFAIGGQELFIDDVCFDC